MRNRSYKLTGMQIAVIMLLFHAFMSAFSRYYAPNSTSRMLYSLVIIYFICVSSSFKLKFRLNLVNILSLLMIFIMLINNQNIKNGNYSQEILFITLIFFFLFYSPSEEWVYTSVNTIQIYIIIHILATIWLSVDKYSYLNVIYPMLSSEYTSHLLSQYNNGWNPGLTLHYSTNAIYLSFAVGFYFSKLFNRLKKNRYQTALWLGLSLFSLLITGKRGHIIFSVLAMFIVYYFYLENEKRTRLFKIFFYFCLLVFSFFVVSIFAPSILNFIDRFIVQMNAGDITTGRGYLQEHALSYFQNNKLFGIGWDGFKYEYLKNISIDGVMLNVHCVYIQLLTETGIVGFTVFISFIALNLYYAIDVLIKKVKRNDGVLSKDISIFVFVTFIQVFFILYCITGNALYDEQTLILYILSCAIIQNCRCGHVKFK